MNLPNRLTLARLGFAALFVVCFSVNFPYGFSVAFGLFLLATFTDWLDGEIARRHQLVTDFGKLMDPLADKILAGEILDGSTVKVDEKDGGLVEADV